MARLFPIIFSQNDPVRKNKKFGDFPPGIREDSTYGTYGCYPVSYATIARYYGKDTTPELINQFLVENKMYVAGNLVPGDDTLQRIFPDIKYQKTHHYENVPADLKLLHSILDDPTLSVILDISFKGGHHFTPAFSSNGITTIANVFDGSIQDIRKYYGDPATNILKFIVYAGIPAQSVTEQTTSMGVNLAQTNSSLEEQKRLVLQLQGQLHEKDVKIKELQDAVNAKNSELAAANDTIRKQTYEIASLNGKAGQLLGDLAAYHNRDKTAIEEGVKSQDDLQEAKNALQKVGDAAQIDGEFPSFLHVADAIIAKLEELAKKEEAAAPVVPAVNITPAPQTKKEPFLQVLFNMISGLILEKKK